MNWDWFSYLMGFLSATLIVGGISRWLEIHWVRVSE